MHSAKSCSLLLALAILAGNSSEAVRGAAYDESILGDLSGVPASPTPWTLTVGSNVLTGTAGFTGPFDVDIVSFTIPTGMQLDAIAINSFHNDFGLSFFGLQPGTPWMNGVGGQVTEGPLVGYALIDNEGGVTNLLSEMQKIAAPPKFEIPLPAGVYTLEMQDLDTGFAYTFDFQTSLAGAPSVGDFNGDGAVDGADLAQWAGDFGMNGDSDADGDGDTDGADFILWQQHVGQRSPINATPEPGGALLLLWSACCLSQRYCGRSGAGSDFFRRLPRNH